MRESSRAEWLINEVNAARAQFERLPEWKKDMLRTKDQEAGHGVVDRGRAKALSSHEVVSRSQEKN